MRVKQAMLRIVAGTSSWAAAQASFGNGWFVVLGFVEFVSSRQAHLWKKAR